ncbi:MAG: efflux RND transporter periplasmic adaptor subunit [Fibrobacterota bacterium]|nr:efflux RND transporter periplasmic adaptor subunit [Fibrobacterota bacterium]
MVNKQRLQIVILSGMVAMTLVRAHEGHVHGDAPPQETAQSGPVTLSAGAKQNLEIQTAEATIQAIEKTIKAPGTAQAIPGTRENVSSKISGKVAELRASLGQFKKKGETLLIVEARQLSETPIRVTVVAPRSGKVVKLNVIKGDAVEPGTSMLELADYGEVYAVARVYESQIGKITKGMQARVYSPVLKNLEMPSKVEIIGSEVNPQSRTVDVWVRVKNPEERLKINMTVNVFFLADREAEAITVPRSAVLGTGGERFVFVEEGNNYVRTTVVTGVENDKWIEIVEGLAPGDVVVTQGNYQLQFAKPALPAPTPSTPASQAPKSIEKPTGKAAAK